MTMAYVAVAVAAVGAVSSYSQARKARKAQAKANKVAERRRALESRKSTVAGFEDARQMLGQVQNVGSQTGSLFGSGVQGALGSIVTQAGANATFNQQLLTFAQRQEYHMQKSMDSQLRSQTYASISQLALSAAGAFSKAAAANTQPKPTAGASTASTGRPGNGT